MVFYIHSCVSQLIPQSLDLLMEDETHSTNCYGYTSKHLSMRSLKKGSINSACFALVKTKASQQCSWKNDAKYKLDLKPFKTICLKAKFVFMIEYLKIVFAPDLA